MQKRKQYRHYVKVRSLNKYPKRILCFVGIKWIKFNKKVLKYDKTLLKRYRKKFIFHKKQNYIYNKKLKFIRKYQN